jgi:hypothetical protein
LTAVWEVVGRVCAKVGVVQVRVDLLQARPLVAVLICISFHAFEDFLGLGHDLWIVRDEDEMWSGEFVLSVMHGSDLGCLCFCAVSTSRFHQVVFGVRTHRVMNMY